MNNLWNIPKAPNVMKAPEEEVRNQDYGLHESDDNWDPFENTSQLSRTSENPFDYLIDRLLDEAHVRSRRNSLVSIIDFQLKQDQENFLNSALRPSLV